MKVNVISINRQHLLDLSKTLDQQGADVKFYTLVPVVRCIRFGLKADCIHSLFLFFAPLIALNKVLKSSWLNKQMQRCFGIVVTRFMRSCDVFIVNGYGESTIGTDYDYVKKKYGAVVIQEWGSKHIIEERKAINGTESYPQKYYDLHFTEYELADYISIPANHVKKSFLMHGIPENKLLINPYGANLQIFPPTKLDINEQYDLLMVGGWSFRKGCDLITNLCRKYKYSFLHVGSVAELSFPNDIPNMKHHDSVNEYELTKFYAKAKVFILPSRTEGLALVQAQALASGLPLVCSAHTGGKDLASFLDDPKWILEMKEYDVDSLNECVKEALDLASTQTDIRILSDNLQHSLSWDRYGKTYYDNLIKILKKHED